MTGLAWADCFRTRVCHLTGGFYASVFICMDRDHCIWVFFIPAEYIGHQLKWLPWAFGSPDWHRTRCSAPRHGLPGLSQMSSAAVRLALRHLFLVRMVILCSYLLFLETGFLTAGGERVPFSLSGATLVN